MALHGGVPAGRHRPSPRPSFLAALLQPQNRQIMNELECCKNVINVYLDREICLLRGPPPGQQPCGRAWGTMTVAKGRCACLGPELGEGTRQ